MREWRKVYSEVWDQIKENTEKILFGDIDSIEKNYHDDYLGWDTRTVIPVNKEDLITELRGDPKKEIKNFSLSPINISVFKETAIVHYFFSIKYTDESGVEHNNTTRNSEILIKSNNKWKVVSDNCGI